MIPLRYIVIDGPDCAGKSSLYAQLQKVTNFKNNMRDRSYLSTLIYSRLYDRPEVEYNRGRLREELCDVNNFYVVLLPPRDVIMLRYAQRGDDFQNAESLMRLYDMFCEEVEKIRYLPNVLVIRDVREAGEMAEYVAGVVSFYTSMSPTMLGTALSDWASFGDNQEVQLRLQLDVPTTHDDPGILNHATEGEYYLDILKTCENIIQAEVSGKNPYNKPQGLDSRRFYYSSDTCIASIHFLPRGGDLKVSCTLRSTDAQRNGAPDLRFLAHLAAEVPRTFKWDPNRISLEVHYNSLHIRTDLITSRT